MNGDAKQPGEAGDWQFKPGDPDPQPAQSTAPTAEMPQPEPVAPPAPVQPAIVAPPAEQHPEVSWNALEFIAHDKSPLWYLALIVVTVGLALLVFLLSHDKVSTTLIIIIGIIFGVSAGRKPRTLQYMLDSKGITINRAFRPYSDFKSFAVAEEGTLSSIIFMPLQRFTLPLSLSVAPEDIDEVVTKLSDYLPNDQTHGHDAFDRFVQRIHF